MGDHKCHIFECSEKVHPSMLMCPKREDEIRSLKEHNQELVKDQEIQKRDKLIEQAKAWGQSCSERFPYIYQEKYEQWLKDIV